MTIAKKIKKEILGFPDDFVFVLSDLDCDVEQREAAARALQRMAERGEISKLANGKYYKPRKTIFGELAPSPSQIAKEYLVKNGRIIGYMTGGNAFSQYSLTTQISSDILIGTNYYRRPIQRGAYKISFVYQPNEIKEDNIELLKLLDCLKYIKDIPGTTANEACKRLIFVIKDLPDKQRKQIIDLAIKYTPFVKALLGSILELIGMSKESLKPLKESLTGISKYRLPISEDILPTKINWRIYEPARR